MGFTYAQSFIRSHIATAEQMMILEHSEEKAKELKIKGVASVFARAEDCLHKADLIILAVKPQDTSTLFGQLKPFMLPGQVILTIMAGVRMEAISAALGVNKIIRAMPNLPAQIGQGMTVFTSTDAVTRLELTMVQNLLSTTGKTIYVEKEEMLNAATAISGSGPAYVYFFMDAMIQAARQMGFSDSEAELLVSQTFTGSIDLYNKATYSCEEWIKRVASKGGTTEAALSSFGKHHVHNDIIEGGRAALRRAEELGK